jgi:hypothetical protein
MITFSSSLPESMVYKILSFLFRHQHDIFNAFFFQDGQNLFLVAERESDAGDALSFTQFSQGFQTGNKSTVNLESLRHLLLGKTARSSSVKLFSGKFRPFAS